MTPERFEQIGQLYNEAAELSSGARAAYLDRICAGDEDLRREVESLLAAHKSVGDFIAAPALKDAATLLTSEAPGALVGKRFDHYQILSFIGAGGMGEVYSARDTRLGRKVAIKLLPGAIARDADRLRRFEQEARAVGMLNHPNILTIHDVGEHEGAPYLVSELLEGETLRERINGGALSLSKAADIALQISHGLAAAHELGLAHRDLKPENLFLTKDGRVKILDFGLAKLSQSRFNGENASEPAFSAVRTNPGMVMGTVGYMAPEQLRGEEADYRADIFAFGVILYEMLTGARPFRGASTAETMSAILTQDAPELPAPIVAQSPGLARVIRRCLEKQPQRRFQSASDLGFALDALTSFPVSALAPPLEISSSAQVSETAPTLPLKPKAGQLGWLGWVGWITAGVFILSTIGLSVALFRRPTVSPRVVPFTSFPGQKYSPVFSPDGNQIAFIWDGATGAERGVYVKLLGAGEPLRVASNPGLNLAWSPDSRSIAFDRASPNAGIFVVPALGGPERRLTEMSGAFAWSPDGKTLAISSRNSAEEPTSIFLLTIATGETRRLTFPEPGSIGDLSPAFAPDGQTLAFIRSPGTQVSDIFLVPVAGGASRRLTFDNLSLGGGLAWTADGREIVFSSTRGGLPTLWRIESTGSRLRRLIGIGEYAYNPSISRAGDRLAYVYRKTDANIWRAPGPLAVGQESEPRQLIASTRDEVAPHFSPDGKKIVFVSDRSGSREIWICESDGHNPVQLTNFGGSHTGTPRWSPDGRWIAFDSRPEGQSGIYVISSDGGAPRRISDGASEDIRPSWSRDGRWIYFGSRRSGDWQIWKVPSNGGQAIRVTKNGGYEAFESPDGKSVYYTKREPGVWKIPVEGGAESLVFDRGSWGAWALLEQGICSLDRQAEPQPVIEFFNFATRQTTPFARLDKTKIRQGNPAVSPDGRWLLYWQIDQIDNDIMLVENFR
jgi:Tol biopolymer transport system component/serine/threonine protein kinase